MSLPTTVADYPRISAMNASNNTLIRVTLDDRWDLARSVRQAVFVDEQACPPDEEWDQYDGCSRHLVLLHHETPVATARWRSTIYEGMSVAKLERIAVLESFRGRGFGREIVEALIADARSAGFDCFIMHAQSYLKSFYESMGFSPIGNEFDEVGIPHLLMVSIPCTKKRPEA